MDFRPPFSESFGVFCGPFSASGSLPWLFCLRRLRSGTERGQTGMALKKAVFHPKNGRKPQYL